MFNTDVASLPLFVWANAIPFLKGAYRRGVAGRSLTFSFYLTDRCFLHCRGCFWWEQARVKDLPDEEVVAFFKRKRDDGYILANIAGGEPYIRAELLERICGIIPLSWVMTAGSIPFRPLKRTTHMVSIDGLRETHNAIRVNLRGKPWALYERIAENLKQARSRFKEQFRVVIHVTLRKQSYREIAEIVEEWARNGLADGIAISTVTPVKGADDGGVLSREERIWITNTLLNLKAEYGDFMCQSGAMIRRLHPDHTQKLNPGICETARLVESHAADGSRIPQCVLGDKADCKECGCVITTMSDSTSPRKLQNFRESLRFAARMSNLA